MRTIPLWLASYPRSLEFLASSLGSLRQQSPNIFGAFTANSGLSDDEATVALRLSESPPLLWIADLGTAVNGLFTPDAPGRVKLDSDMFSAVEAKPGSADAQVFLQAKVLHELVHWGRYTKQLLEPEEMGEKFERDAYGRIVEPHGAAAAAALAADALGETAFGRDDVRESQPRGIRNHNPGNIRRSGIKWEGLADEAEMTPFQKLETVFCVFKEPKWGIRAISRLLANYQVKSGLQTVRAMIARWAPASDNNDTDNYSRFVATKMGVTADTSFRFADTLAVAMVTAVIAFENNAQPYSATQIKEAVSLGLV
jgi:zincin-like metallopeptidase toxin 3 of polymorphic toxin system